MRCSPLKREAENIIEDLNLLETLGELGEARIVGSVVLNLIVKLDIDVHVVVTKTDLLKAVNEVYSRLLERPEIDEVRISDYRPDGVKLGIDRYRGESGDWSIDMWFTEMRETAGFEMTERLLGELNAEHRETIMELKRYYHGRGLLRDGLSSKIYSAVIEGVRSVEEFKDYPNRDDDVSE